jgi:hypothetical protein
LSKRRDFSFWLWPTCVVGCVLICLPAYAADSDSDGLQDDWEQLYFGNIGAETGDGDADGDSLTNATEQSFGSSPVDIDSDNDFVFDAQEFAEKTNPNESDSDGDGLSDYDELNLYLTDPTNPDTDGGKSDDGSEVLRDLTDPKDPIDDKQDFDNDGLPDAKEGNGTSFTNPDSDGDGILDGVEDRNGNGIFEGAGCLALGQLDEAESDPTKADTDGDGLCDGNIDVLDELGDIVCVAGEDRNQDGQRQYNSFDALGLRETNPRCKDSDGDGIGDKEENDSAIINAAAATPGNILDCPNALRVDSDFDKIPDKEEIDAGWDPCNRDTDGDDICDQIEKLDGTDPTDETEPPAGSDPDGDCLSTTFEMAHQLDPNEVDTDGDGVNDDSEYFGFSNPADVDSDDDGIWDGREVGNICSAAQLELDPGSRSCTDPNLAAGELAAIFGAPTRSPSPPGTDLFATSVTDPDTDGDGLWDGLEVGFDLAAINAQNAAVTTLVLGPGNTDLNTERLDTDPLSRTNPYLADTDGDGIDDGVEDVNKNGKCDCDKNGDGNYDPDEEEETDPSKRDTDDDGIFDGYELEFFQAENCAGGLDPLRPTDNAPGSDDLDADGVTNLREMLLGTNPCIDDTDGDGLLDGEEDANQNGIVDPADVETNTPAETDPKNHDSDGDTLLDGIEKAAGTSPTDTDSDDDGVSDQIEPLWNEDSDGDGKINALDTDSDNDGVPDGIEMGLLQGAGAIKTDPLKKDTDGDGLEDGEEDADKNGLCAGDLNGDGKYSQSLSEDVNANGQLDSGEDLNGNGVLDVDVAEETCADQADMDLDGLSDRIEVEIGTSPYDDDSDDDLLYDGLPPWLDKAVANQLKLAEDKNNDGILDADESDPLKADTDGGGIDDGQEVLADDTNPRDPDDDILFDSDGDGLADTFENDFDCLDFLNPDSDGDTLRDGDEYGLSRDPRKDPPSDTDLDGVIDGCDLDSDDDGLSDQAEAGDSDLATPGVDTDGDGLADYRDLDSDGGGVSDNIEFLEHGTDPTRKDDDGLGHLELDAKLTGRGCQQLSAAQCLLWPCLVVFFWRRRIRSAKESAAIQPSSV